MLPWDSWHASDRVPIQRDVKEVIIKGWEGRVKFGDGRGNLTEGYRLSLQISFALVGS